MPAVGAIVQWTVQHRASDGTTFTTGEKKYALVVKDNTTTSDIVVFYESEYEKSSVLKKAVPNAQLT
jgi:hypothetical protein